MINANITSEYLEELRRNTPPHENTKTDTSVLSSDFTPAELEKYLAAYTPSISILLADDFIKVLSGFFGKREHWAVIEQYLRDTKVASENVKTLRRYIVEHNENSNAKIIDIVEYADQLQNNRPKSIQYQNPKIMPLTGVIVVAGRPKLGKSYLMLNLAIAIAKKGKFAGYFDMAYPGAVLYMALEDNRQRMYARMEALCGPEELWPSNLGFVYKGPKMDNGRLSRELVEWIDSVDTPRLIIIDIFARVKPKTKPNTNMYDADYDVITELSDLAMAHGVSIAIVTHLNQKYAEVENITDAIMGSTGIIGGVSTIYAMSLVGTDGVDAELSVTGKDVPSWTVALQRIDCGGHIDWKALGDIEQTGQSESRQEILQTLYEWDGRAPRAAELRDALGRSKDPFNRLIKRMRIDGLISLDKGRLFLTDKGRDTAEFLQE